MRLPGFAKECKWLSLLARKDKQKKDVLEFLGGATDCEGWKA